jgi:hypothetical protein
MPSTHKTRDQYARDPNGRSRMHGGSRAPRLGIRTASSTDAFAFAGTIVITIAAFSLQINEDTRFLVGLVPFIAVLFGWSLSALRRRSLSLAFLAAFSANALVNHALAFGFNPFGLTPYNYIIPPENSSADRLRLSAILEQTCTPEATGRWIILGINYALLNGSSANFLQRKTNPPGQRVSVLKVSAF